jgi:hypothetical protein
MTIAIAVAVVLALGAGVAWALARFLREIARYDEWDSTVAKRKRASWSYERDGAWPPMPRPLPPPPQPPPPPARPYQEER